MEKSLAHRKNFQSLLSSYNTCSEDPNSYCDWKGNVRCHPCPVLPNNFLPLFTLLPFPNLLAGHWTCQICPFLRPLHVVFLCLECSSPRFLHSFLPYCIHFSLKMPSIQGTLMVVQWLRCCASSAEGKGWIPNQRIKMPHTEIKNQVPFLCACMLSPFSHADSLWPRGL